MFSRTLGRPLVTSTQKPLAASTGFTGPHSSLLSPAVFTRLLPYCAAQTSPSAITCISSLLRHYATSTGRPKAQKKTSTTKSTEKPTQRPSKPKSKPKRRTAAKKKPAAKKRTTRKKKEITPEQALRTKVSGLRKVALTDEPKKLPENSWTVYVSETSRKGTVASSIITNQAAQYKALAEPETERLRIAAQQNRVVNARELDRWIHAHTADQIRLANNARVVLNRIKKQNPRGRGRGSAVIVHRYTKLKDDRAPKRGSISGYMQYVAERRASGDFQRVRPMEASKALSAEWRALSPDEQKKYNDLASPLRAKFIEDFKRTYPTSRGSRKAKT